MTFAPALCANHHCAMYGSGRSGIPLPTSFTYPKNCSDKDVNIIVKSLHTVAMCIAHAARRPHVAVPVANPNCTIVVAKEL